MYPIQIANLSAKVLDDKKAHNIKIVKIEDVSSLADYVLLANGTSSTHVKALADETEYKLKKVGIIAHHVEGYSSNSWILLDYRSVIVHIFTEEARDFYNLDELVKEGQEIELKFDING